MKQSDRRVVLAPLLTQLAEDRASIVDEVVADVLRPGDDAGHRRIQVEPVVRRLLDTLADELTPTDIRRLQAEGAAAARAGERVAEPIDRYLSAGWAIWDAATRSPGVGGETLRVLGAALLRSGDRAAAALAEGHGAAEREIAGRAAGARRAFVDDLLQLDPTDMQGLARLRLRGDTIGMRWAASYRPVVAWVGRDLEDATTDLGSILARAVRVRVVTGTSSRRGRPTPLAPGLPPDPLGIIRTGRLVLILPSDRVDTEAVSATLEAAADQADWLGVLGPEVGAAGLARGVAGALRALDIAHRLGREGVLLDEAAVALESALLGDPDLLRSAVDHELGAIAHAPRKAQDLLLTLQTYLEQGQNIRATARVLGVAPRTIAYRIERIETALGQPLEGRLVLRLAAALLAREALGPQPSGVAALG